jgi:hypothetical protein
LATAGVRGDWQNLTFVRMQSPCSPAGCTTTWVVASNGHVTGIRAGALDSDGGGAFDVQLTPDDLNTVRGYADGVAGLRSALRDGLPCLSEQVTDLSVAIELELSTEKLSANIEGCLSGANVFAGVYQVISKY